jgi:DNA-binding NtrC family response regulator
MSPIELTTSETSRRRPLPSTQDLRIPGVNRKVERNNRILIVDDNDAIHQDYRKILTRRPDSGNLSRAMEELFDDGPAQPPEAELPVYELAHANQGKVAFEMVRVAMEKTRPFALAFIDMRMPPGWNGVETIKNIWKIDNEIEVVLCTAYSDFSWAQIHVELQTADRLLILKKPYDSIEVRQLACSLTSKWELRRSANQKMRDLDRIVEEQAAELAKLKGRPA